jgi:hypothetical protein
LKIYMGYPHNKTATTKNNRGPLELPGGPNIIDLHTRTKEEINISLTPLPLHHQQTYKHTNALTHRMR